MSKFGLDLEPEILSKPVNGQVSKLTNFPPSIPKTGIDLIAADAASAQHGFVSREATPRRRRRVVPSEAKRQLSILMPMSKYERFVAYADRHRMTYEEVISHLMDVAAD